MRSPNFIPPNDPFRIRDRGRLPHWELDNAIYFVTFRLKDALPRHVVRELVLERERINDPATSRAFAIRFNRELDAGYGACLLKEHGEIVASALEHFDEDRYRLHSWCVMPNHVHVVFELTQGRDLARTVHSWKSWTSHQIDKGEIWQREYFDRIARDQRDYLDMCEYVEMNPASAGLIDWAWSSAARRRRASRRDAGAPI